jgi:molybdate transport system regulatory protein
VTRFEPRQKLWLEADGRLVMSDYRLRLLQLVADTGSLAQAATVMGLSYRRAWGKVKELEANLGYPLVRSEVGGAGGGHTVLSDEGRNLLDAYRRFGARMDDALQAAYREELAPLERCAGGPQAPDA